MAVVLAGILLVLALWFARSADPLTAAAGLLLFCVLGWRVWLAWTVVPSRQPVPPGEFVSVLIPAYNEDPRLLVACLESLTTQARTPDRVWVVDDGSADPSAYWAALSFAEEACIEVRVMRLPHNAGKRHAQAAAIRRDADATIFVTVDSDGVLHRGAIQEGLRPFSNPEVTAVGGVVRAMNARRSLLARIQDLEYVTSFVNARATMSALGAVMVNSGALGFYRAELVRTQLDEYVNQRVLRAPVHTGDDRMLTQLAMRHGRTVVQYSAVAYTTVPENFRHLVRQRIRWAQSFWINTAWVARHIPLHHPAFWLVGLYWSAVAAMSIGVVSLVALLPVFGMASLVPFFFYLSLYGYLAMLRYLAFRWPDESVASQLITYIICAPLLMLFQVTLYMWIRYYALFAIRRSGWRTRSAGIEVGFAGAHSSSAPRVVRRSAWRVALSLFCASVMLSALVSVVAGFPNRRPAGPAPATVSEADASPPPLGGSR